MPHIARLRLVEGAGHRGLSRRARDERAPSVREGAAVGRALRPLPLVERRPRLRAGASARWLCAAAGTRDARSATRWREAARTPRRVRGLCSRRPEDRYRRGGLRGLHDARRCELHGGNRLAVSNDEGSTWVKEPPGGPGIPRLGALAGVSLSFPDPLAGFVLSSVYSRSRGEVVLDKTTDGGRGWTRVATFAQLHFAPVQ